MKVNFIKLIALLKSYFEFLDHGKEKLKKESYTSELTTQLNENEVLEILKK